MENMNMNESNDLNNSAPKSLETVDSLKTGLVFDSVESMKEAIKNWQDNFYYATCNSQK